MDQVARPDAPPRLRLVEIVVGEPDKALQLLGLGFTFGVATAGGTYTATEQQMINDLKASVNAQATLLNQMRSDLVALGLIKGAA